MELKVGMYVRTEYGISKIVNIYSEKTGTFIETDNRLGNCNMSTRGKLYKGIYILEEDYKIFIDNNVKNAIIDLIEVGDYVNGSLVEEVGRDRVFTNRYYEDGYYNSFIGADGEWESSYVSDYRQEIIYDYEFHSIVTKEQFESMSYKVGE